MPKQYDLAAYKAYAHAVQLYADFDQWLRLQPELDRLQMRWKTEVEPFLSSGLTESQRVLAGNLLWMMLKIKSQLGY